MKATTIKRLLNWRGMSQADLAKTTEIPPPTISRIVRGVHTHASVDHARKIAICLGVTIDQMYSDKYVDALISGEIDQDDDEIINFMIQGVYLLEPEEQREFKKRWFEMLASVKRGKTSSINSK